MRVKHTLLIALAIFIGLAGYVGAQQVGPYFRIKLQSSHFVPPSGYVNLWAKTSNSHIYRTGSDGIDYDLGAGGAGGIPTDTMQLTYNNGDSTPTVVGLDSTRGGLRIRDNATPLGSTLFGVESSGATNYFSVGASSILLGKNTSMTGAATFATGTGAVTLAGDTTVSGSKTFSTGTGTVSLNGATVFAANKGVTVSAGTSAFDFSGGTGIFKTPTGAVTVGPGAIGVSGIATFSKFVAPNYAGTSTDVQTVTWTAPSLTNSYANVGGAWAAAGYYKDSHGMVHVRFAVSGGTNGAAIFTLPAGFRPSGDRAWVGFCNNAVDRILITSAGVVQCNTGGNTNAYGAGELMFTAEN